MKFKTILFSLALVSFTGAANAADDFTGGLYLPGKGRLLSNTSVQFGRTTFKNPVKNESAENALYAREYLTYGVTDNFSVIGAVGNDFDYQNGSYNNDHNFDYFVGGKYNFGFGNVIGQVGVTYYTNNPKDYYGHRTDEKWYKELDANVQLGYKMNNGLTPYTSFTAYDTDAFTSERTLTYSWFVGAHKTFEKAAVDAGIRYDFAHDVMNEEGYFFQAEANYFVRDNVALGVFGDYMLDGSGTVTDEIDYQYTAGVHAKVLF